MKKLITLFAAVILLSSCGNKPEADFTWSPESPKAGQEVKFTNLSKNALTYLWHFGDMSTGDSISPTHIYKKAGNYIIDLTASKGLKSNIKAVKIIVTQ